MDLRFPPTTLQFCVITSELTRSERDTAIKQPAFANQNADTPTTAVPLFLSHLVSATHSRVTRQMIFMSASALWDCHCSAGRHKQGIRISMRWMHSPSGVNNRIRCGGDRKQTIHRQNPARHCETVRKHCRLVLLPRFYREF